MAHRKDGRGDGGEGDIVTKPAATRIGDGDGGQKLARIGMLRIFEDRRARADFHDPAQIHHTYLMGDPFDHGHVMADEQVTQAQVRLQVHHQVDDLRLHGHIQRADRLIRDDQLGVYSERAGYGGALALAARQFMRKARHELARQADAVKDVGDPVPHGLARARPKFCKGSAT